jgi:hypothetical protein
MDMLQEHLNLVLEDFCKRSDIPFDSNYLRNIICPNLARILELRKGMLAGAGLAPKSGSHTEAPEDDDLRTLLRMLKSSDAHCFVKGRSYETEPRDVDDYSRGVQRLRDGRLQQFIRQSTRARAMAYDTHTSAGASAPQDPDGDVIMREPEHVEDHDSGEDSMEVDEDHDTAGDDETPEAALERLWQAVSALTESDEDDEDEPLTNGTTRIIDGEVVVLTDADANGDLLEAWEDLPASEDEESGEEDEEDENDSDDE